MNWKILFLMLLGCILLRPAPSLSEYSIPVSATTEGSGVSSDDRYELVYTLGQSSPSGISVTSTYTLSSGLIFLLMDAVPPTLTHEPPLLVTAGLGAELQASVSDERTGIDTVRVYFHEGGLSTFRERAMQPEGEGIYSATLPPSSVTERGLAYYLEAVDRAGNVSHYPSNAPESLLNLSVYFPDLVSAVELPANQYRMISVPGIPTDGHPDSVLVDDLGEYSKTAWRLGRWNTGGGECSDGCYDEYPAIDDFRPGKAFWLISRTSKRFDVSGLSPDVTRPLAVRLQKGWNQVATPFGFTTDWLSADIAFQGQSLAIGEENIIGPDTVYVEDNLISYDGSYHGLESRLQPWAGYWIYNSSTQEVDLMMRPVASPLQMVASPYAGRPMDLILGLVASSRDHAGNMALAGLSSMAKDSWDVMDLHEPPPIDRYLRVVFAKDDWGRYSGTYMTDIRHSREDGADWDFRIEASDHQACTFDIEPVLDMPDQWQVCVYDLDAGIRLTPDRLPYTFSLTGGRELRLVAGTEDYIRRQEAESDIRLTAQIVSAMPNPFDQTVSISYFLPGQQRVSLRLFSVTGRAVTTLVDRDAEAGLQYAVWNGESDSGDPAAPGIYFLCLSTGDRIDRAKLIKLR